MSETTIPFAAHPGHHVHEATGHGKPPPYSAAIPIVAWQIQGARTVPITATRHHRLADIHNGATVVGIDGNCGICTEQAPKPRRWYDGLLGTSLEVPS